VSELKMMLDGSAEIVRQLNTQTAPANLANY
jgi:hypothetical protein